MSNINSYPCMCMHVYLCVIHRCASSRAWGRSRFQSRNSELTLSHKHSKTWGVCTLLNVQTCKATYNRLNIVSITNSWIITASRRDLRTGMCLCVDVTGVSSPLVSVRFQVCIHCRLHSWSEQMIERARRKWCWVVCSDCRSKLTAFSVNIQRIVAVEMPRHEWQTCVFWP